MSKGRSRITMIGATGSPREIGALGMRTTPSAGNFLLLHFDDPAQAAASGLIPDRAAASFCARSAPMACRTACASPSAPKTRTGSSSPRCATCQPGKAEADDLPDRSWRPRSTRLCSNARRSSASASSARRWRASSAARVSRARSSRYDASRRRARASARIAIADDVADSAAAAVADADLVILCAPVGAMGEIAREIGPHLKAGAIVSDVGSVKSSILAAVAPHLPAFRSFHPGASGRRHGAIRSGCRLRDRSFSTAGRS